MFELTLVQAMEVDNAVGDSNLRQAAQSMLDVEARPEGLIEEGSTYLSIFSVPMSPPPPPPPTRPADSVLQKKDGVLSTGFPLQVCCRMGTDSAEHKIYSLAIADATRDNTKLPYVKLNSHGRCRLVVCMACQITLQMRHTWGDTNQI